MRGLRALRLMGVTSLLEPTSQPRPALAGLQLAYDGRDARIYRIDAALPRAFIVGAQQVVRPGEAARHAVGSPDFDPRRAVVTD